jgi:c-di-GMP-binding flagellar brake protein YcgR
MTDPSIPPNAEHPPTPPASLELDAQGFSQYLLYSRSEILFVLRQVMQKKCMITVYFDEGRSFFLTTLVAVSDDGNWLYFDTPSDPDTARRALGARKLMLTTMLERVKIQFSIDGVQEVAAGNRKSYATHLPETLLRLQRREHFRLSTPVANPIKCAFRAAMPGGQATDVDATVADISGGGVGLVVPEALAPAFPIGATFSGCTIVLPEEGTITTGLCVRNSFAVTTKTGARHWRVGCEYVNLPGPQLTHVQRYITRVERERKARDAGLG